MADMMSKISSGLERAFAARGFAEPSVEDLRDAAGVSLRTFYKYTPSRADMVDPNSEPLRRLLERHKAEVASKAAAATGLAAAETELLVIIEGLTQAWPLRGDAAVEAAKRLGCALRAAVG